MPLLNYSTIRFFTTAGLTLLLSSLLMSQSALADVYRSVDQDGKVIFTDQPSPNAKPVDLKETNTAQPVTTREPKTNKQDSTSDNYKVTITKPRNEQLFPNRLTPFKVMTEVTPGLQKGHRLRLKVDGEIHSLSIGSFTVSDLNVGGHSLLVEIIDSEGTVITSSPPVSIFAQQPG